MLIEKGIAGQTETQTKPAPLIFPTSSSEFTGTLAHYYRGEMARMMSWRDRIDRTTNWAITVAAAMLSVSLSTPTAHHGVLLFAMVLVFLLLSIESRRYRFFDVYRSRVRLLERHYYAQILAPHEVTDARLWMNQLGDSLRAPNFSITHRQAMARRLRRNYGWMFLILLLAWLLKTTAAVLQPGGGETKFVHSTGELLRNAAISYIPGWVVLISILAFYSWLLYVILSHREAWGELAFGEVHV
jgi:uncharacterized membrane protein